MRSAGLTLAWPLMHKLKTRRTRKTIHYLLFKNHVFSPACFLQKAMRCFEDVFWMERTEWTERMGGSVLWIPPPKV